MSWHLQHLCHYTLTFTNFNTFLRHFITQEARIDRFCVAWRGYIKIWIREMTHIVTEIGLRHIKGRCNCSWKCTTLGQIFKFRWTFSWHFEKIRFFVRTFSQTQSVKRNIKMKSTDILDIYKKINVWKLWHGIYISTLECTNHFH